MMANVTAAASGPRLVEVDAHGNTWEWDGQAWQLRAISGRRVAKATAEGTGFWVSLWKLVGDLF